MPQVKFKPLVASRVAFLVVHCSATRPSMDWGRADIDRLHRSQGWFEIGYHYVIKRSGTVEVGRQLDRQGAHAARFNHLSVGICLIGGVTEDDHRVPEDNFTDAQLASLRTLLVDLKQRYPHAEVLGHRDLPNVKKACPSFDVRSWVRAWADSP